MASALDMQLIQPAVKALTTGQLKVVYSESLDGRHPPAPSEIEAGRLGSEQLAEQITLLLQAVALRDTELAELQSQLKMEQENVAFLRETVRFYQKTYAKRQEILSPSEKDTR